jgi:hypothetical protein
MIADENVEIDEATWATYFFNLDELIVVFKDEPDLPKALVASLMQGYVDVVAACANDKSPKILGDYSFKQFRYAYRQRMCKLLECSNDMLVTRLG